MGCRRTGVPNSQRCRRDGRRTGKSICSRAHGACHSQCPPRPGVGLCRPTPSDHRRPGDRNNDPLWRLQRRGSHLLRDTTRWHRLQSCHIGRDFTFQHTRNFNTDYMRALSEYGFARGSKGPVWDNRTPIFAQPDGSEMLSTVATPEHTQRELIRIEVAVERKAALSRD